MLKCEPRCVVHLNELLTFFFVERKVLKIRFCATFSIQSRFSSLSCLFLRFQISGNFTSINWIFKRCFFNYDTHTFYTLISLELEIQALGHDDSKVLNWIEFIPINPLNRMPDVCLRYCYCYCYCGKRIRIIWIVWLPRYPLLSSQAVVRRGKRVNASNLLALIIGHRSNLFKYRIWWTKEITHLLSL